MIRLILLGVIGVTTLVWAAAAVAAQVAQADAEIQRMETRAFFGTPDECTPPCWRGIRPGVTDSTDALDRLNQMGDVTHITYVQGIAMNEAVVDWAWNGQQSPVVDSGQKGRMWLYGGIVYIVDIPLTISVAAVRDLLGEPDAITTLKSPRKPPSAFYKLFYYGGGLELRTTVLCPLTVWNTLSATVDLQIQDRTSTGADRMTASNEQVCP